MFQYRIPKAPLTQFVSLLWLQSGENLSVRRERLLPDGAMELVIDLHNESIPLFDSRTSTRCGSAAGSVFCGAHSQTFLIERSLDECVMGVHFQPGGAFPFFNLPIAELTNAVISLEDLWKSRASELREVLIEAPTSQQKFDVLEAFLLSQAKRPLQHHPAVTNALHQWQEIPTCTVRRVAEQSNLSARRFIQLFRDEVGLNPKLFCRVRRFQNVLRRISSDKVNWLDAAFESGYFDQAHLIHEFHTFSGLTPKAYLAQTRSNPNNIGLPV